MIWHHDRALEELPLAWARAEHVQEGEVFARPAFVHQDVAERKVLGLCIRLDPSLLRVEAHALARLLVGANASVADGRSRLPILSAIVHGTVRVRSVTDASRLVRPL